jgi:hypothetical protein
MLVVLGMALAGCPPVQRSATLNELDGKLRVLSGSPAGNADADRAKIAAEALSTAKAIRPGTPAEQLEQVAWYRLAAVASVEAREQGEGTLGPSRDGGAAACDALPNEDASAPRDCTLVRLTFPIGVVQNLDRKAAPLLAKRDAARAAGQKLEAADLPEIKRLFAGYDGELERLTKIAGALPAGLDPRFAQSIGDDQRAIYCRLPTMISTALAVQGQDQDTVRPLWKRKDAARQALEPRLGAIDCMNPGRAVALPQ